jgi:hypothetical protein
VTLIVARNRPVIDLLLGMLSFPFEIFRHFASTAPAPSTERWRLPCGCRQGGRGVCEPSSTTMIVMGAEMLQA